MVQIHSPRINPKPKKLLKKMMNLFFLFIDLLGKILPKKVAEFISERIADICYFTIYKAGRLNYEENISPLFDENRRFLSLRCMRNFSLFIYEFILLPRINKRNFKKYIFPVNIEKVFKARKEGKGVIILTAHLGNYEWGAAMLRFYDFPLTVISLPYRNKYITNFYEKRRTQKGMNVIYTQNAIIGSVKALRNNELLALLGDRVFSEEGIKVKMFNKNTLIPLGPFYLSLRTGAPVIPSFAVKEKDGRYHVYFEDPIKFEKNIEEAKKLYINRWMAILEKYIKKYPAQWYRFDKVWTES